MCVCGCVGARVSAMKRKQDRNDFKLGTVVGLLLDRMSRSIDF